MLEQNHQKNRAYLFTLFFSPQPLKCLMLICTLLWMENNTAFVALVDVYLFADITCGGVTYNLKSSMFIIWLHDFELALETVMLWTWNEPKQICLLKIDCIIIYHHLLWRKCEETVRSSDKPWGNGFTCSWQSGLLLFSKTWQRHAAQSYSNETIYSICSDQVQAVGYGGLQLHIWAKT